MRVAHTERGQAIYMVALLIPVLLGMAAIAVDLGAYAAERRALQNDADAIALAAAQDLPDATAAEDTARSWASKNGIAWSSVDFVVSGGTTNPRVSVTISRHHEFALIKVLGVGWRDVGAKAVAAKVSPAGVGGLMPWAITQATVDASRPGDLVTIKFGAGGGTTGNYGAIDIDGNGASVYRDTVEHGSQGSVCSTAMPNCTVASCPGSYPDQCAENAASCDGPECASETGNMVGPTDTGVQYRIDHTSAACDTFAEAFIAPGALRDTSHDDGRALASSGGSAGGRLLSPADGPLAKQPTNTPTSTPAPPTGTPTPAPTNTPGPTNTPAPTSTPSANGQYKLNPACNPWAAGACPKPDNGALCSRRVIVIPIVDSFGNGKKDVTVLGFAMLWLEGSDKGDVTGRFVNADVNMNALAGAYDPGSLIHFVRLVE